MREQNSTTQSRIDRLVPIFKALLEEIEPNSRREGITETPERAAKAWIEFTRGYDEDPFEVMKAFDDGAEGYDEMVIVHGVPIVSRCEHHLESIVGTADIGYIPNQKIVGLSKLIRLADILARRLQVQERLTNQIAEVIESTLETPDVAVMIKATHGCICHRGVNVHGSKTTTSALRGVFKDDPSARQEFLLLCSQA